MTAVAQRIDWTPAMDKALINKRGGFPPSYLKNPLLKGIAKKTIEKRHYFLKQNYVDVGWGSLIGEQKIHTTDAIMEDYNVF